MFGTLAYRTTLRVFLGHLLFNNPLDCLWLAVKKHKAEVEDFDFSQVSFAQPVAEDDFEDSFHEPGMTVGQIYVYMYIVQGGILREVIWTVCGDVFGA